MESMYQNGLNFDKGLWAGNFLGLAMHMSAAGEIILVATLARSGQRSDITLCVDNHSRSARFEFSFCRHVPFSLPACPQPASGAAAIHLDAPVEDGGHAPPAKSSLDDDQACVVAGRGSDEAWRRFFWSGTANFHGVPDRRQRTRMFHSLAAACEVLLHMFFHSWRLRCDISDLCASEGKPMAWWITMVVTMEGPPRKEDDDILEAPEDNDQERDEHVDAHDDQRNDDSGYASLVGPPGPTPRLTAASLVS